MQNGSNKKDCYMGADGGFTFGSCLQHFQRFPPALRGTHLPTLGAVSMLSDHVTLPLWGSRKPLLKPVFRRLH